MDQFTYEPADVWLEICKSMIGMPFDRRLIERNFDADLVDYLPFSHSPDDGMVLLFNLAKIHQPARILLRELSDEANQAIS